VPARGRPQGAPLQIDTVLKLAIEIADALEAAHAKGIIHRDIKPANIFITQRDQVKVLDFGLAKLTGGAGVPPAVAGASRPRLGGEHGQDARATAGETPALPEAGQTEEGAIIGTVAYMSPEQAQGKKVDARSDIFSFGSVLYEMVTGRRAFQGETKLAMLSAVLDKEPTAVSAIVPKTPPELEKLIARCLRKDPERRIQHMGDVKLALEELKEERTSAKVRARRLPIALAIASLTFVTVAGVLFALNAGGLRDRALGRAIGLPRIESLAVLPLENLSRDPEQEYFADGMTEELITDLAKISALKVISRTSVMHYKGTHKTVPEIAKELGVDALIEGSVQRSGSRVRINTQLIHAPDDRHMWAESYERDLKDVLALQDEVARTIAGEIKVTLTPQEQRRLASARPSQPGGVPGIS